MPDSPDQIMHRLEQENRSLKNILKQKDKKLEQKDKKLEQKDKKLEQKDKKLEQKDKKLEQKDKTLKNIRKCSRGLRKLLNSDTNLVCFGNIPCFSRHDVNTYKYSKAERQKAGAERQGAGP